MATTSAINLQYPLGFLLGSTKNLPSHFKPISYPIIGGVHPLTKFAAVRNAKGIFVIIGEAIHPDYPDLEIDGIAEYLNSQSELRQHEIDKLLGRFAILEGSSTIDLRIQNDAIGMRSVFFSPSSNGIIVGSHAKLVAEASFGKKVKPQPRPHALGYPGISTPFPSVWRLPPNCKLSLDSGRLIRFFPRESILPVRIHKAYDIAFSRAQTMISALAKRRLLLLSLTAGIDSRTTLAAVRNEWPNLSFFTYNRNHPKDLVDSRVAGYIAKSLSLRHMYLHIADEQLDANLMAVIKNNTYTNHQHKLAHAYHVKFGAHRFLHVRSNLLELGRSNLFAMAHKKLKYRDGLNTADVMARYYNRVGKLEHSEYVLRAFENYVAATDYNSIIDFASTWDLFFIEHRMGAWHAGILLESDIAFDTVIAFNSREVLSYIMGVPQEERSSSPYLLERIRTLLPELANVPINPST